MPQHAQTPNPILPTQKSTVFWWTSDSRETFSQKSTSDFFPSRFYCRVYKGYQI